MDCRRRVGRNFDGPEKFLSSNYIINVSQLTSLALIKETMANFVPDINNLDALVGKTGKFMWTGMMVHGTITAAYMERSSTGEAVAVVIEYDMDEPHVWGSDTYTHDSVWGRLPDNFGPLCYTELD